jgi:hypothetical protein
MGSPDPLDTPAPRRVSTLLGHAQVAMAMTCLSSLLRYSAEPLRLRLHDDGTLTPEDRERLVDSLTGAEKPEFLPRAEADERLGEILAGYPALCGFRERNPLALKLVDVALLADEDLAYCDSDVLFLRPFRGLFRLPPGTEALFMRDRQEAYSVRSWHLPVYGVPRLASRLNTGLVVFKAGAFDLDLADWFFARPQLQRTPVWAEQTCWALLAGQVDCRLFDAARIVIPTDQIVRQEQVALHFVSSVRSWLASVADRLPDRIGEPPVMVASFPAKECGTLRLTASEVRRGFQRVLRRHPFI